MESFSSIGVVIRITSFLSISFLSTSLLDLMEKNREILKESFIYLVSMASIGTDYLVLKV